MPATRECDDIDAEIDSLRTKGYRLDMIMPADAPRVALLSKGDDQLRLITNPKSKIQNPKSTGRAGMLYSDLIPSRLGGQLIASHIRITEGGPVPDYVHYHKVRFQMIYCKAGTIRVVYEDQGLPFELRPGDCILQPPEIRHRVLESSAGAEVIELSSPAEHETWVEHNITLPTRDINPDREFNGQRFVQATASDAEWQKVGPVEYRETGINLATRGIANVRVAKLTSAAQLECHGPLFVYILTGEVSHESKRLAEGDSILQPTGGSLKFHSSTLSELLLVSFPGL